MSVLETFYLLFKADTSDLKKGSDDAIKSTEKLTEKLKSIDKTSEKIGSKFLGIASSLSGLIASFASIHSVISGISNAVSYDIELGKASRALGVNSEELDIWGNAVKQAGGTSEGFQNSLRNLASHFHTTASVAIKAFPQLADVFSHISRYSAFNLGKAYGIDEGTILLLQQGRREVEKVLKQQRELGVVTQKDIEVSTKYNQELQNLDHSFRTLYNAIVIPILPALTSFFKLLEKGLSYLTDHKDLVVGAFVGIAASAISAAIAFGLISGEIILTTAVVIILIGLFALLWEDIKVYFRGGKSLIGEYIEEWKKLGKLIDNIIDGWTDKFLNFLSKFDLLKPIVDYIRNEDNDSLYSQNKYHKKGADLLAFASSTPLNTLTSNSVLNSSAFNRNFTINSMPIKIVTQATDAVGIASSISLTLPDHLSQATNYFADNNHA
jgi:hypothetical protein